MRIESDMMRLKPIALVLGFLTLISSLIVGDYNQADSKLSDFYSQMLAADFPAARGSIDEAIRLWPTNARYYAWRGYNSSQNLTPQCRRYFLGSRSALSAVEQHAISEAIADYGRALELNSRDAVAHRNRAWLEHLIGDDYAAEKDWQEATAIDPETAVLRVSYGMFLEESGKVQAGREQIEVSIQLSPSIVDSPFSTRYRIRSQEAADTIVAHSLAEMERELRNRKDPILEARLGKLYVYSHNLPRSMQLLQDAARQLPNLPLVWFNLGEAYLSRGDTTRAMDCYRKANLINDSLASPYLRMGQIYLHSGQRELANLNLRQTVDRWQRRTPITASHNNRLYSGPKQRIDDLLPTTLVWFAAPCEASKAYQGLAELARPRERSRYVSYARTCEQIPAPHRSPPEKQ